MKLKVNFLRVLTALMIVAAPQIAAAQATRTWVSGVGDDANPCNRTAPCKTFAGAISKTAPSGEINVLDPGGFGAVTITKAITIRSDHVEAGVLVSGTNGIVVAAGATDTVVLEGLDIEGVGSGLNGVKIVSGLNTYVIHCAIRRFTQNGVDLESDTANARAFVKDLVITLNGGGVNVKGAGVVNAAAVINTLVESNSIFGIQATNAGNVLGVANSVISGNPTAISLLAGASAISFGPSNVVSGPGAFTATNPFK